jgi:hypothetical protein
MSKDKAIYQTEKLNIRLTQKQKENYTALSKQREQPISVIIKGYLDKEVKKNK